MPRKRRVKPSKGASKAIAAFKKRYGSRWKQVYYGRASRFGAKGLRPQQKANSIYSKGSHRVKRSRRKKR